MLNKTKYLLFPVAVASLLASCDNVEMEDRFIPVDRPEVKRVVLVNEFTGMSCVNCPTGAATLHNLQDLYPDNLIIVGVHPQNNINTKPIAGLDLTCPLATEWESYFKPEAFPACQVNFGTINYNTDLWSTDVIAAMQSDSPLAINLTVDYDEATRTVTAQADATFNKVFSPELNLMLIVTENGIKGMQKDKDKGLIRDYVHNHVLRGSLNGTWGQSIGSDFVTEQKAEVSASMVLDDSWNAENCEIIAVALQAANKSIEQAAAVSVVSDNSPQK